MFVDHQFDEISHVMECLSNMEFLRETIVGNAEKRNHSFNDVSWSCAPLRCVVSVVGDTAD